jgi:hypothetical protein
MVHRSTDIDIPKRNNGNTQKKKVKQVEKSSDLLNCGQFEKYEFNANAGFGWAESGSPRKPNS